jgi:hypothetical protein
MVVTPGSAPLPIACDLAALSAEQRSREQALLAEFRPLFRDPQETAQGFSVVVSAEPKLLARLGEFLALERLCCPFLTFDLSISSGQRPVTLHVHGGPGTKPFLRSVFFA